MGGQYLDVDVELILKACGINEFRHRGNEIRARCPYHPDPTPSWEININSGIHHCFGCGYSGDIVKLIADFMPEVNNVVEALNWLFRTFPVSSSRDINLELEKTLNKPLDESILKNYMFRHSYLYDRGFEEETLRAFDIGYCREDTFEKDGRVYTIKDAITIPWRNRQGELMFIKYRFLTGKLRYLNRGGSKDIKSRILFGLDKIVKSGAETAYLVEGEFDAMYCWQNGLPAVALGGSQITKYQIQELYLAGVKKVCLFLDNDKVGIEKSEYIKRRLSNFRVMQVKYPRKDVKDPNSLTSEEIKYLDIVF